jgi:putative sterol carrier protein
MPVNDLDPHQFFASLPDRAEPERIQDMNHSYLFDITGSGKWLVEVRGGEVTVSDDATGPADVTFKMTTATFEKIQARKQNPMVAYMTGKLKVSGDIRAAMALQAIL